MPLIRWNGPQLEQAARHAAKKAIISVGGDIVRDAKRYAPTGVAGQGKRGIAQGPVKETPGRMTSDIGFTPEANYMQYVELGRRAGKRPPPGVLDKWVERVLGAGRIAARGGTRRGRGSRRMKGNSREQEIKTAAFLVGRAIGKRGIKPRPMIGKAAATHAGQLPAVFAYEFKQALAALVPKT